MCSIKGRATTGQGSISELGLRPRWLSVAGVGLICAAMVGWITVDGRGTEAVVINVPSEVISVDGRERVGVVVSLAAEDISVGGRETVAVVVDVSAEDISVDGRETVAVVGNVGVGPELCALAE